MLLKEIRHDLFFKPVESYNQPQTVEGELVVHRWKEGSEVLQLIVRCYSQRLESPSQGCHFVSFGALYCLENDAGELFGGFNWLLTPFLDNLLSYLLRIGIFPIFLQDFVNDQKAFGVYLI